MREAVRRREVIAVAAVNARATAERARTAAEAANLAAGEALAAAAVTFGGPEKASAVTGISAVDFRAARRDVSTRRAAEVADRLVAAAVLRAGSRRRPSLNVQIADTNPKTGHAVHGENAGTHG